MQLRSIPLHAGVDPETEARCQLTVLEFEPLRINEARFGIDRRHTNAAGRKKASDLWPKLPGGHINQRPALTREALNPHCISLIVGGQRCGSGCFKLGRKLGALRHGGHGVIRLNGVRRQMGRHVDWRQLRGRLVSTGVIWE